MRRKEREYTKDYEIVEELNARGKKRRRAVYRGKYYRYDMPEEHVPALKLMYAVLMAVEFGLYVGMGLCGSEALGAAGKAATAYILIPYVLLLLPLGMCMGKVFMHIITVKGDMEFATYDRYVVGLRRYSVVLAVAYLVCTLAMIVYMCVSSPMLAEFIFLACAGAGAFLGWLFLRIQDRYPCLPVKKADPFAAEAEAAGDSADKAEKEEAEPSGDTKED